MRARWVGSSFFPAASHPSRLPSTNESREFSAQRFHRLTKPFSRNPFLLILIQTAPGVCDLSAHTTPLLSTTSTLFTHSFAQERSSSHFFSIACALFAKTPGVYPNYSQRALVGLSKKYGGVFLLCGSQRQEVLSALDGLLQTAEELLQVFAAFDEVNVGGIDDEEVGGFVAEEEMFVGAGDFFDVVLVRLTKNPGAVGLSAVLLFGCTQRKKVLCSFHRLLQTAQQLLKVFAALDEVYIRRVDHQQIRGFVAEEEVFVGSGDFFDIFGRDLRFAACGFFGDARAQRFRLGLQINHEVRRGNFAGVQIVIAFVEFQLFVIEIQVGEDAVFFHQEIGEQRRGRIRGEGFAQSFLALQQKVHLRAKGGAGFFLVKIGEKRIVFAIVNAAGVEAFGKDAGQRGFADAQRAFDGDETGSLRPPLGDKSALGRGVLRHWQGIIAATNVSGQGAA